MSIIDSVDVRVCVASLITEDGMAVVARVCKLDTCLLYNGECEWVGELVCFIWKIHHIACTPSTIVKIMVQFVRLL